MVFKANITNKQNTEKKELKKTKTRRLTHTHLL